MKKNESKKPLWAQNNGQTLGRKTRKSKGKSKTQLVMFDIETSDGSSFYRLQTDDKSLVIDSKKSKMSEVLESMDKKAKKKKTSKPNWATGRARNIMDVAYKTIVEDRDPEESLIQAEKRYAATIQKVDERLKKFTEKYAQPVVHTSGYMSVIPDSHFWADLEMLINWARYMPDSKERNHLLKGLQNTKDNGYHLVQLGKQHAQNVPGTFAQHYDYLNTVRQAAPQDEFVKIFLANRPTKIFCEHWSKIQPLYTILAHYDFVQTRPRKQTPSVRIQAAFEDTSKRVYLPAFYRLLTTENQHRMPFTSLSFR